MTHVFGVHNLALAEDVVQETLARAFEVWKFEGVPAHYQALLVTSAKNRALDVLRRRRTAQKFAPELARTLESEWTLRPAVDELFLPDALRDDELRMMFSCCHPRLREEVQVALILNILCGFGVGEIAKAFFATESAIEKRLSRGKKALAGSKRLFVLTTADLKPRLAAVQRALYLLFSEGYHSGSPEAVVRADLCREAIRLVRLLIEHAPSATPETLALAALMHLDAARLPGRVDEAGNLRGLFEQDRSCWDAELIREGLSLLERSAFGDELSVYHVEAAIAGSHAAAATAEQTRWDEIIALYDLLMRLQPSPVVALNRGMAIAQRDGPGAGLDAIRAIAHADRLLRYPFYHAALGELELRRGKMREAEEHFRAAHRVARNDGERRFLDQRLADLSPG
jgi:RNA polymerase sigma-70 factor (ECF subfamily)